MITENQIFLNTGNTSKTLINRYATRTFLTEALEKFLHLKTIADIVQSL